MKLIVALYVLVLSILTVYSYGFVDPNLTLSTSVFYQKFHRPLFELVFNNRLLSTIIFVLIIFLLSIFYLLLLSSFTEDKSKLRLFSWLATKKRLGFRQLKWLIVITIGILLFSYPAFSYDIFNYILTAKVTFLYKENPYIIMPIELVGEPNLIFTRAANKIALYGPSWIGLTAIPHIIGFGNILLTLFSFKALIAGFYFGAVWMIWKISKNSFSVALFALNPLIIVETLVGAHNDIIMMFFALLAFYLLKKNKVLISVISFVLSIFIKFATIFLIPIFIFTVFKVLRGEKITWENIFHFSGWIMFAVFLLSPLREEIYPWYAVWILSFAVLIPKRKFLLTIALTLSLATLLRYIPVLYTGSYSGQTPLAKELVTFIPLGIVGVFWLWRKLFLKPI